MHSIFKSDFIQSIELGTRQEPENYSGVHEENSIISVLISFPLTANDENVWGDVQLDLSNIEFFGSETAEPEPPRTVLKRSLSSSESVPSSAPPIRGERESNEKMLLISSLICYYYTPKRFVAEITFVGRK